MVSQIVTHRMTYTNGRTGESILLQNAEGRTGAGMPPIEAITAVVPFRDGERLKVIRYGPRELGVPMYLDNDDATFVSSEIRRYARVLNPKDGYGTLTNVCSDGTVRELKCMYTDGWQLEEMLSRLQAAVLTFMAYDEPMWYDVDYTIFTFEVVKSNPTATWFPIPKSDGNFMALEASAIAQTFSVFNGGDDIAWPTYLVTGPGSHLILNNLTTGEKLELGQQGDVTFNLIGNLNTQEVATIITKPKERAIYKGANQNLFPTMSDDSVLFGLIPGENSLTVEMADAASPESQVEIAFKQSWFTV